MTDETDDLKRILQERLVYQGLAPSQGILKLIVDKEFVDIKTFRQLLTCSNATLYRELKALISTDIIKQIVTLDENGRAKKLYCLFINDEVPDGFDKISAVGKPLQDYKLSELFISVGAKETRLETVNVELLKLLAYLLHTNMMGNAPKKDSAHRKAQELATYFRRLSDLVTYLATDKSLWSSTFPLKDLTHTHKTVFLERIDKVFKEYLEEL